MSQFRFFTPQSGLIFVPNKSRNVMSTLVKLLVIIILNTSFADAQETTHNINVEINGLKSSDGQLLVGLYNTETSFLKEQYKANVVTIDNNKSVLLFKNVPNGTYAVSFVHDKNKNGKMDKNFMGIPKEDYGCSNNAKGFMGPPKWEDAKFELKGTDKSITISL